MRRLPSWLLLTIIPLIVATGLLGVTSEKGYSPVIMSDSISYIESARWFAAGQGVSLGEPESLKPMTHFPPLYPIVLAAGTMSGLTAQRTACALHPVFLAVTLFFIGALVLRLGGSVAVAVGAQWFATVSWDFLGIHLYAYSEPLFLAFSFGAIYLLAAHSRKPSLPYLACAAVLLGLATMTHFAGLGIVCAAAIYLVWASRHRLRDAAIILIGGAAPFIVWTISQKGDGMHGIDRELGITVPRLQNLDAGMRSLGEYLVPNVWPHITVYVLALILLGILAVGVRWPRTRVLATIALGYIGFILFSSIVVDPGIPLDSRMLLPVFPIVLAIVAVAVAVALRSVEDFRHRALLACVLLVFCVDYADLRVSQVSMALPFNARYGVGYEETMCRKSPVISRLAAQPVDVLILSGNPVALHFLLGRTSLRVPVDAQGPDDRQVVNLARRIKGHSAVFIDCPRLVKNQGSSTAAEMRKWFQLALLADERDGCLYRVRLKDEKPQMTTSSLWQRITP